MNICQTEESTIYTPQELAQLDARRIPYHIAIIPDGNRRWAKEHHISSYQGHQKGADVILTIVRAAKEIGIKVVTLYLFSTENWNRSKAEIKALFFLLEHYLKSQKEAMVRNGIRLGTVGNVSMLPTNTQNVLAETKAVTACCSDIHFVMALNYGGRDEIRRVVRQIVQESLEGRLKVDQITEEKIASYLDTAPYGDPDLFIRTGGELRISNFLLWQISYSEIYNSTVFWPDFTPDCLYTAVKDFQRRERRIGS